MLELNQSFDSLKALGASTIGDFDTLDVLRAIRHEYLTVAKVLMMNHRHKEDFQFGERICASAEELQSAIELQETMHIEFCSH